MICDACETSNNDDAQYCKGCGRLITAAGTTVEATPDVAPPPAPVTPPPAPITPPAAPPPAPPIQHTQPLPTTPPDSMAQTTAMPVQPTASDSPEPPESPPAWIFILGGVAIGGLLLLLVTILIGNSDEPTTAPTATTSAQSTTIDSVVQTTQATTSTTVPPTTAAPTPSIDEFFGSAVAIFASIPKDGATFEEAQQRADAIATATGATVRVIDSSLFASLRDGFWVVAEGKYANPEEAAWRCWDLGLQTANECYGRQVSDDPADLNGTVVPIPQP